MKQGMWLSSAQGGKRGSRPEMIFTLSLPLWLKLHWSTSCLWTVSRKWINRFLNLGPSMHKTPPFLVVRFPVLFKVTTPSHWCGIAGKSCNGMALPRLTLGYDRHHASICTTQCQNRIEPFLTFSILYKMSILAITPHCSRMWISCLQGRPGYLSMLNMIISHEKQHKPLYPTTPLHLSIAPLSFPVPTCTSNFNQPTEKRQSSQPAKYLLAWTATSSHKLYQKGKVHQPQFIPCTSE